MEQKTTGWSTCRLIAFDTVDNISMCQIYIIVQEYEIHKNKCVIFVENNSIYNYSVTSTGKFFN